MQRSRNIDQLKLQILVSQGMLQCNAAPKADKTMHETCRQRI